MKYKVRNTSHSRQPVHTVDGVRHIGPRRTREFELSEPGKKLVRSSEALSIVTEAKPTAKKSTQKPAEAGTQPEASDVHSEGGSAPAGKSGASGSGAEGSDEG